MVIITGTNLPTNTGGVPQVEITNTDSFAVEVNTDAMEATLTAIKGIGTGSIDDVASRCQTIMENTEFVNGRLNNIQNSITQDGLGGGNKLGVINDSIASACNTIKDNTEFVNSRLNNIQTAQTDKTQITQLAGRTNITDDATKTNLLCDATGHLQVDITNQPISQIQPVNGLNSDHADHNQSIAVGLRGRTTITDESTGKFLLCDSAGHLQVDTISAPTRGTMTIPAPFGSGATSSSVDIGNDKTFHFHTEGSAGGSHAGFVVQGSNDDTNFVKIQLFTPQTVAAQVSIRGSVSDGYRYYRLENAGTSVSVTTKIYNSYI